MPPGQLLHPKGVLNIAYVRSECPPQMLKAISSSRPEQIFESPRDIFRRIDDHESFYARLAYRSDRIEIPEELVCLRQRISDHKDMLGLGQVFRGLLPDAHNAGLILGLVPCWRDDDCLRLTGLAAMLKVGKLRTKVEANVGKIRKIAPAPGPEKLSYCPRRDVVAFRAPPPIERAV